MADDYFIPYMPKSLGGLLYTPGQDQATTKRLREQLAGNPRAQQQLAIDDRFHQGKGMMEDSPAGALAAMVGAVPYDAAKLAYFHGPKPVKRLLGNISERMFPGEGFNDKTTSRPDVRQYLAMRDGMVEGAYSKLRQGIIGANVASERLPLPVLEGLSRMTQNLSQQSDLPTGVPLMGSLAMRGARGGLNTAIQTLVPYADNRDLSGMTEESRAPAPPMSAAEMKKLDDIVRGWKLPPMPANPQAKLVGDK